MGFFSPGPGEPEESSPWDFWTTPKLDWVGTALDYPSGKKPHRGFGVETPPGGVWTPEKLRGTFC